MLGIEERSPLNAVTEATRAALEAAPVIAALSSWLADVAGKAGIAFEAEKTEVAYGGIIVSRAGTNADALRHFNSRIAAGMDQRAALASVTSPTLSGAF